MDEDMVFIAHPCFLWPMEACQSPGPGSRQSWKMDKEALKTPYKSMCLASTHPIAHWQLPVVRCSRILGLPSRTSKRMGKLETENWAG